MKKIIGLVIVGMALSGCMTTTHRMSYNDLKYMQPDCANKESQIRFLETQMTTPWDRALAYSATSSLSGTVLSMMDDTYEQKVHINNREYDAVAKRLIWELRTQCQ